LLGVGGWGGGGGGGVVVGGGGMDAFFLFFGRERRSPLVCGKMVVYVYMKGEKVFWSHLERISGEDGSLQKKKKGGWSHL